MTTSMSKSLLLKPASRFFDSPKKLTFSPLAWLKFQFLCHAGPTEVAAFGYSTRGDPLHLDDVIVVRQHATPGTVAMDDHAVADLFDAMADAGIPPGRFARIWLHTHPGASVEPSGTDEETFERVFGGCDWAVMGILGRTGNTYARLRFNGGPGGSMLLPTAVDWSDWPAMAPWLSEQIIAWEREYLTLVEVVPDLMPEIVPLKPCPVDDWLHDPFFGEHYAFE